MRQAIPSDEAIRTVEKLVNELRAINHWDREYWRRLRPEWDETVAFVSRQKRRNQIIGQMLKALQQGRKGNNAVAKC